MSTVRYVRHALLLLVMWASGCTSAMLIETNHPDARVYVDGEPEGRGSEVSVNKRVGGSRAYTIEARVGQGCRRTLTVNASQSSGRVVGCYLGSLAGGALGGMIGASIVSAATNTGLDATAVGYRALAGAGLGALVGLFCLGNGYEAPAYVDMDMSDCKPTPTGSMHSGEQAVVGHSSPR